MQNVNDAEKLAVLIRDVERMNQAQEKNFERLGKIEDLSFGHELKIQILEKKYDSIDTILVRGNGVPGLQEQFRSQKSEIESDKAKIKKLEEGYIELNTTMNKFALYMDRFDETLNKFVDMMNKFDVTMNNTKETIQKMGNQLDNNTTEINSMRTDMVQVKNNIKSVDDKGKIDIILLLRENWYKIIGFGIGAGYVIITIKPFVEEIISTIKLVK